MRISPDVTASSPPIMLSVVVLPQPEDPRRVTNSRSAIAKSISRHTLTGPYALLTFTSLISGMSALEHPIRETTENGVPQGDRQNHHRSYRYCRCGHHLPKNGLVLAGE